MKGLTARDEVRANLNQDTVGYTDPGTAIQNRVAEVYADQDARRNWELAKLCRYRCRYVDCDARLSEKNAPRGVCAACWKRGRR
jgi:hypothetical protein